MLRYAALTRELPKVITRLQSRGEKIIVDYARENCDASEGGVVAEMNRVVMRSLPAGSMCALKISSFGGPDLARESIDVLARHGKLHGIKVCIDAEDVVYPELSYDIVASHNTPTHAHVYKTYQMYRRKAMDELLGDIEQAHKDKVMLGAKLVRGAYLRTQDGLFDNKDDVDHEYNKALTYALVCPHVHTIMATHNERSLRYASKFDKDRYVTAQLLGMGRSLGQVDYRYVAFGSLKELTPYLFRRLCERASWN